MKYHGPKEGREAAQASDAPAAELEQLSRSEHIFVCEAVAANPGTPGEVLAELQEDPSEKIRSRARRAMEAGR